MKVKITPEIQKLFPRIDREEFPETIHYLLSLISSDEDASAFDIATDLLECDKPKAFPEFLVSFITELFQSEIESGNTNAMNDLAAQYYCGRRGFEQSFEKAVELYQQAAQHGNRKAQENLGYCYYYGRDGEPDYEKAFQYFAMGAFDGWPISMYKIGDMYLNGYYVEKNEKEAFIIYNRCLSSMPKEMVKYASGPVHLRLGKMYLQGVGTEIDLDEALWHFHAAEYFLYGMIKDGDYMYKKSLREAIDGQETVRKLLELELPEDEWTFDD